ncbi:hypothetical protein BS17DRAFT_430167 [Gyrodon lividus]|nr:hypothetical protein BS17DRAFT_430167 [Gyrodon lividus]
MNGPRPSQSAEAARAAALQAEFNEKKWVWVPDEKEGYLAGWVHQEDEETAEIVMSSGGEIRRVPLYALSKMNPPKFDRVDDIADLTFLNEASVVHNLRLRICHSIPMPSYSNTATNGGTRIHHISLQSPSAHG